MTFFKLFGGSGVLFLLLGASNALSAQIELPCISATDPAEVLRQKKIGTHAGQRLCQPFVDKEGPRKGVLAETLAKLKWRVKDQADCAYQGVQLDPTSTLKQGSAKLERPASYVSDIYDIADIKKIEAAPGGLGKFLSDLPRDCTGGAIATTSCNILSNGVPGTFNQGIYEIERNHLGASCGDWPYFGAVLQGVSCVITPDYTRAAHSIEDSFNRGAYIQALNCAHAQVENEIRLSGKLTLSKVVSGNGDEVDGPCSAMSIDYSKIQAETDLTAGRLMASSAQVVGELASSANSNNKNALGNAANLLEVENCTDKENVNGSAANFDQGGLRQSACHILTARKSLESLFMQLAACEVWTRASRSYEQFLGKTTGEDEVTQQARASINGSKSRDRGLCSASRILDEQYKPTYLNRFQARANAIWNAGACR